MNHVPGFMAAARSLLPLHNCLELTRGRLSLVSFPSPSPTANMDKASRVLAQGVPPGVRRSFRALADHGDVARTTLHHRARGRRSIEEKAQSQHYHYPWEEKALVKFLVQQDALGRSVRIKYVGSIAFSLACQRPPTDRPRKPPGRKWPQSFYKRHPELKARKSGALDWNRYDIYERLYTGLK
jgi:hypothetical protein